MTIVLEFNDYTGISQIDIQSFQSEPVMAENETFATTIRHTLRGTGLISATSQSALNSQISLAREAFGRPLSSGNEFSLKDGAQTFIDVRGPGDPNGTESGSVRASIDLTEVANFLSAIVSFEIVWEESAQSNAPHVIEHSFRQQHSISAEGHNRITVSGRIVVRKNSPNSTTPSDGGANSGNNPDAYRLAFVPLLPDGFRRERMDFAVDEAGNKLAYTVEMIEAVNALPSPATAGRASFDYVKQLGSGADLIGRKVFSIELTGSKNASPGDLLAQCVRVSSRYIIYTAVNGNADLIQGIRVRQRDMFNENTMEYQVTALGTSSTGPDGLTPINLPTITGNIMEGFDPGELTGDISPYGSALLRSAKFQLYDRFASGASADIQRAEVEDSQSGNQVVTSAVVIPTSEFDDVFANIAPGGSGDGEATQVSNQHALYQFQEVKLKEEFQVKSNFCVLKSQSIGGVDIPYQVEKPDVYYVSEGTVSRLGFPPERQAYGVPANAIVVANDFSVSEPKYDTNGNPIYTAHFRRKAQLFDVGINPNPGFNSGWGTASMPSGFAGQYRRWWPPIFGVFHPLNPKTSDLDPGQFDATVSAPALPSPVGGIEPSVRTT